MDYRISQIYCFYGSPLGQIRLMETEEHLVQADFSTDIPEANSVSGTPLLRAACRQLDEYFSGSRQKFDLPLKPQGTTFQRSAWKALLQIPYGETRSYSEQARMLGSPKAVRAVGQANSHNPISIIIPCHRVIGKNGTLTGYAGGLERKTELLELERGFKQESFFPDSSSYAGPTPF